MRKSKTVDLGHYYDTSNPGLKAYFRNVELGREDVIRATLYSSKNPQDVLGEWLNHLESLNSTWPALYEFELDLAEKVGPMSVMFPVSERIDDINAYYDSVLQSKTAAPISDSAIAAVLKEWSPIRGLEMRSQERTVEKMKKSTNSGSPYFTKRKNVVKRTVPCQITFKPGTIDKPAHVLQQLVTQFNYWDACATLGWRGQEGGPLPTDTKQRVVWMFPFSVNVAELQVYQPLVESAQKFNLVPAWVSLEAVFQNITHMFDTKGEQDLVICTDFSKFDQTFGEPCQIGAYNLLERLLNGSESSRSWLWNVFPVKYFIPLAYGWNMMMEGWHGMASGSGGTNADETLVHRALQYEAAQSVSEDLNLFSQCLGDDGVITYPGIKVEDVIKSYTSHGLEMNPDKQYIDRDNCTYLRRLFNKDYRQGGMCVGVYSTARALGRLMYQERYYDPNIWGPEMVALRQLSILENVKYHPLREEFVSFCMKGDKYRLGLDIPGFYDDLEHIVVQAIDHMPDFLGYTRSNLEQQAGINSWWIVQYLKSLT